MRDRVRNLPLLPKRGLADVEALSSRVRGSSTHELDDLEWRGEIIERSHSVTRAIGFHRSLMRLC
jgi:hypothetical protein